MNDILPPAANDETADAIAIIAGTAPTATQSRMSITGALDALRRSNAAPRIDTSREEHSRIMDQINETTDGINAADEQIRVEQECIREMQIRVERHQQERDNASIRLGSLKRAQAEIEVQWTQRRPKVGGA